MCGRFLFSPDDEDRVVAIIEDNIPGISGVDKYMKSRGDIYPSQVFPIISEQKVPEVTDMIWGYPPVSSKSSRLLINARSETAEQKYTFRNDFSKRRCIIPATGFYEWSDDKNKYLFTDKERVLFMGGLYTNRRYKDKDMDRFIILTKKPDRVVSRVHNRMPVLIPPHLLDGWLNSTSVANEVLHNYSVNLEESLA